MASTFSPSLKLELIGDGDQSGIWGQTTNTNLGTLLEQAITGVVNITMVDANYTLTSFNGVADESRNAVLVVSGTNNAARDIIAPLVEKLYVVKNSTVGGYAVNIRAATGSSVSVPNGATVWVYCDGTNFNAIGTESVGNFEVNGELTVTGNVSATSFAGAGLTITSINASNISAGTIVNARTTAASANGASTIVARDSNGSFVANGGTFNGDVTVQNMTASARVFGTSPNSSSSGAVTLRDAPGNPDAVYLQATNNNASAQYAVLKFNANNTITAGGTLIGNLTGTATNASQFQSKTKLGLGITGEVWGLPGKGANVTYNNGNAYPIMVAISWATPSTNGSVNVFVNGVEILAVGATSNSRGFSFIVPAGADYIATQSGSANIYRWAELS